MDAISDVLASWSKARTELGERVPQGRLARLLDTFPIARARQVQEALRTAVTQAVRLEDHAGGYVRGPVMGDRSPILWPVATVWARPKGSALEVQLRLAMFFEHDGHMHACGWRFETAEQEGAGRPHPYVHAQQISGFAGSSAATFLTSEGERGGYDVQQATVNQMRPCFPLRGSTCVGLPIAMLATLYGAPSARRILELGSRSAKDTYRSEAESILG